MIFLKQGRSIKQTCWRHNQQYKRKEQQVNSKDWDWRIKFWFSFPVSDWKLKSSHSSLYESWSSTPILHFTLTGTFVFAAITHMASATNFPCKSYAYVRATLHKNNDSDVSSKQIWTFGSSMSRTPKHPCPATLGLGHPQLLDNREKVSVMGLNKS